MGPQALVEEVGRTKTSIADRWLVAWQVRNIGQEPFEILAGRLPHSQFRAEEKQLSPKRFLLSGESTQLELEVSCDGAAGTVVENAFLILSVRWAGQPWRVFARMRVLLDDKSGPQTTTELVTTQRIGFSTGKNES